MKLISQLRGLNIQNSDKGAYIKGSSHRIPYCRLSKDVALFCGLLWGDGWIKSRDKARISGDWRIGLVEDDKGVIQVFCKLVEDVFNIRPKVRFRKTYFEVYFNNRLVYEIVSQIFGFPNGYKIGKLRIPKLIKRSENIIPYFLSGVFSTDGKFTLQKNYPCIGVSSATKEFIDDIYSELKRLEFNPRKSIWNRKNGNPLYQLTLNGKEQAKLFAKKINFVGDKNNLLNAYVLSI